MTDKVLTFEHSPFRLHSPYDPAGDQGPAIEKLTEGVEEGLSAQTLLGVTGSGKTFTMANVIARVGVPALVMAPNKTLAAQLYSEMREFFPENAVEYFVSYNDYYQPEAYVPARDLFIEKDSAVNEHIEQMRLAATKSILERRDTIIVATVSAIYGIGKPESYTMMRLILRQGDTKTREDFIKQLVKMQYKRNDLEFLRGTFRVRGDTIDVFPAEHAEIAVRIELFDDEVDAVVLFDPLTGQVRQKVPRFVVYPASHYVTPRNEIVHAIGTIKAELKERLAELRAAGKEIEAARLQQRTLFDLEMLDQVGFCKGIENYSRHLTGLAPGEAPPCLIDYLPSDALMFFDESHVMLGQLGGMYRGDRSRKETLVNYGFRLPSALDNRPLRFDEFERKMRRSIFVSATPAEWELKKSSQIVGDRVLVTTLTKRMAEELTEFLSEHNVKVRYLHSDIDTVERVEIIRDLRAGVFDVLVGINLLREGLDIPEVSLVAILDADKEGFLRSTRSLIQTIGRAARNVHGKAILYADKMTDSMKEAIGETERRRAKQQDYNKEHGITPRSVVKEVREIIDGVYKGPDQAKKESAVVFADVNPDDEKSVAKRIKETEKKMLECAKNLDFEQAAMYRDRLEELKKLVFGSAGDGL